MLERSYATGHGTSVADLLQELEWQVAEREREACARVCDDLAANDKLSNYYAIAARAIRARGIDAAIVAEVGIWGEEPVDAVNMSQDRVDETEKGEQKTPLKVLNLTVFTENRLRNGRVYDVETLQTMTNRDILAIPDIGKKALAEVLEALAKQLEKNT